MPFLNAGGHRLEYVWHGPSADHAPTLVFLHEGLGSITQWRDFPRQLAATTGCGALVYNRLGHGGSDPLENSRAVSFMHDEALIVLPDVLRVCQVVNPILVGHSDGASMALIYTGTRTGPVTGLVLEAPHVFVEDLSVRSIRASKEQYETTNLPEKLARHHGANTERMFRAWNDVWLAPEFRNWNIEEYLKNITVPILIVQGLDDQYGTVKQLDTIASQVKGRVETVLLPDCAHSPHRDQPDRTLEEATRFILELRSDARHGAPPA
jgi:pimeloyl-ACP methyl ester carboxylesterase